MPVQCVHGCFAAPCTDLHLRHVAPRARVLLMKTDAVACDELRYWTPQIPCSDMHAGGGALLVPILIIVLGALRLRERLQTHPIVHFMRQAHAYDMPLVCTATPARQMQNARICRRRIQSPVRTAIEGWPFVHPGHVHTNLMQASGRPMRWRYQMSPSWEARWPISSSTSTAGIPPAPGASSTGKRQGQAHAFWGDI